MEKMNCIVLDDESMGRKLVEENVRQIPFLNLVGSCKNAFEAMEVLAKEPVDLIKIDVEGSELFVIQGAANTIDKYRPSVQVEIVPKQCQQYGYEPQALYDFFSDLDYVCVCAVRNPANKDQRDLFWGKNMGMEHRQIKKYMDRLFVPREVHERTDYGSMKQVSIENEELFDFG